MQRIYELLRTWWREADQKKLEEKEREAPIAETHPRERGQSDVQLRRRRA